MPIEVEMVALRVWADTEDHAVRDAEEMYPFMMAVRPAEMFHERSWLVTMIPRSGKKISIAEVK